jgi:hypothetical protein
MLFGAVCQVVFGGIYDLLLLPYQYFAMGNISSKYSLVLFFIGALVFLT